MPWHSSSGQSPYALTLIVWKEYALTLGVWKANAVAHLVPTVAICLDTHRPEWGAALSSAKNVILTGAKEASEAYRRMGSVI
jgi:hypothetical protein